ncbi:hypothetical protein BE08_07795 [Sorangium cellulosum]|uniref:Uncharacterized protein n=1 Tax=Sorangium cellulosum TaxID=56 RepID=A0A150PH16_SORCE|nr:hypothetical protein BE08_07795 [Sorangium cellulosum]
MIHEPRPRRRARPALARIGHPGDVEVLAGLLRAARSAARRAPLGGDGPMKAQAYPGLSAVRG